MEANPQSAGSVYNLACAEAMLGELSHVSRVVFPLDANTAAAALRASR